jgi:hypothetical protein
VNVMLERGDNACNLTLIVDADRPDTANLSSNDTTNLHLCSTDTYSRRTFLQTPTADHRNNGQD